MAHAGTLSIYILTIYYVTSYSRDVVRRMKKVVPGYVNRDGVCDNVSAIKTAVGPAIVAELDECDAVVVRLEHRRVRNLLI